MTPAKGLQIPERESAPVTDDPAVVAGKEAEAAKAAWFAMPDRTVADEETPEYKAAEERSLKADQDFADAPVASVAGALVKLRALLKELVEDNAVPWVFEHVRTVAAFMEGSAGEVQAEPLVALWTERNRMVALCNAADTDSELDDLSDELSAIEREIANTEAKTLAGVVVQIRLRESVLGDGHWIFGAALTRNVVTALERMGGCVVTEPDPVVTLFAEWGAIQDEADAHSTADPEAKDTEIDKLWNEAIDRRNAVQDQIMATPATSMLGVAVKLRLATHYVFESGNLDKRYATPARNIDYAEINGGTLGWPEEQLISALLDAERLAGGS